MRVTGSSQPFGSRARTRVLLALQALDESYARELVRIVGMSLSGIQRALQSLEEDGLVAGRLVGRVRLYRLNPRAYARLELQRYLERLLEAERDLRANAAALRRRPRRTGKPL